MSYKNSSPDERGELMCQKCGAHEVQRLARRGFLQIKIYPLFGYYPWECPKCRETIMIKMRYKDGKGHKRREARS